MPQMLQASGRDGVVAPVQVLLGEEMVVVPFHACSRVHLWNLPRLTPAIDIN